MTIQLKDSIFIAGVHQAAGTSLTLGADVEAELVNRGVAVYTKRIPTPGETSIPGGFVSKVFTGTGGVFEGTGTTIPTSVAGPGDYTTKLQFMGNVRDDLGLVDMVNHRIYVPDGYKECRIIYNLAWSAVVAGWRGCRTKNGSGGNYGNTRINSVGAAATTNNNNVTPWIGIVESGGVSPDTINAGDYFEFWPAQNSGVDLVCGADLASSFVQLEVR